VVEAVTVNMGRPRLARGEIPMTGPAQERCVALPLSPDGDGDSAAPLAITAVSMGNPHAVAFVDRSGAALRALAESVGPRVEHHPWFPQRSNAEFAHVRSGDDIELVVWERGCGITLACGTGACATVVAACLSGHAQPGVEVRVRLLGGDLAVTVAEDFSAVYMRGPATHVFEANIDLSALQPRLAS
jgi:diaminopimelate epimerase